MQSDRLIINNIDLSSTVEESISSVVGFTIAKCQSGPSKPILINNLTELKNVFGVSSAEYPELYEVERFIGGGYSCFVGNSGVKIDSAYVPCIIVTNNGYVYTKAKYTTSGLTSTAPVSFDNKYYYHLPVTYVNESTPKLRISLNSSMFGSDTQSITIDAYSNNGTHYKSGLIGVSASNITNKYIDITGTTLAGIFNDISTMDETELSNMTFYYNSVVAPNASDIVAYVLAKYPSSAPVTTFTIESAAESKLDSTITTVNKRNVVTLSSARYNYNGKTDYNVSGIIGTFGTESENSLTSFDESNDDFMNQVAINVIYTDKVFNNPVEINLAYLVCGSNDEPSAYIGSEVTDASDKDWSIADDSDYDDVDLFFDPTFRLTSSSSVGANDPSSFFALAKTHMLAGFIFNQTVNPNDLKTNKSYVTKLTYGKQYWNVCNKAVVKKDRQYLETSLVGAKALLQAQIIDEYNGGLAPMFTTGNLTENISSLVYKYTKSQQTQLDKFNYNPVIYDSAYGLMSTSQKTCKDGATTDWSYIGHASAFLNFEKEVYNTVMIPQLGKANNPYYRELRKQQVEHLLEERLVSNRIWAEGIVDTSTAEGVNDEYARKARKFVISVKVKVDIFSEYVVLNFTNVDQGTSLS